MTLKVPTGGMETGGFWLIPLGRPCVSYSTYNIYAHYYNSMSLSTQNMHTFIYLIESVLHMYNNMDVINSFNIDH